MRTSIFSIAILFISVFAATAQAADSTANSQNLPPDYYRLDPTPKTQPHKPRPLMTATAKNLFGNNKKVTLPSGTSILLETRERKFSDEVTTGTTLHFKVVLNVMAEGKVAIRTGAAAIGVIKEVRNASYNNAAEIVITLRYVQAVDDTLIPLLGDELTVKGQYGGEGIVVMPLQQITATVANNTEVEIQ
jgi:hypothetical protein